MIGTVSPKVVEGMKTAGLPLHSAGIAIQNYNAIRMWAASARGKELSLDVFESLPEHLAKPQAVYLDQDRQEMIIVAKATNEDLEVLRLQIPQSGRWKGHPQ